MLGDVMGHVAAALHAEGGCGLALRAVTRACLRLHRNTDKHPQVTKVWQDVTKHTIPPNKTYLTIEARLLYEYKDLLEYILSKKQISIKVNIST